MTSTLPPLSIKQGLEIWREETVECSDSLHLSEDVLQGLAVAGGLKDADTKVLEHLASCSCCLSAWADYQRMAQNSYQSSTAADDWYAGGICEAASTGGRETVSLSSTCGRFVLSIYYDQDCAKGAMVVLEVTGEAIGTLENSLVSVRDRAGVEFLHGPIIGDRLARRLESSSGEVDLQAWSIRVGSGKVEE